MAHSTLARASAAIRHTLGSLLSRPVEYHAVETDADDWQGGHTCRADRAGRAAAGTKLRRIVACIGAVICVTILASVGYVYPAASAVVSASLNPGRRRFIDAVLANPVEGLPDPDPIRQKCRETKYYQGLIWHCPSLTGGIGNAGNEFLNCMRYAVEAGATTVILPRIRARQADDLFAMASDKDSSDLSGLFDIPFFLHQWQRSCPEIRAVVSASEISNLPPLDRALRIKTSDVKKFPMQKYTILDPTGWREAFDKWADRQPAFHKMTTDQPVRVLQRSLMFEWTTTHDPAAFVNAFSRLFRFPPETRRLAAAALWNLQRRLNATVLGADVVDAGATPSSGSFVNRLGPHRLPADAFMGAHLRVASDAVKAGWPGYDAQVPFYLAEAKKRNLTTIYVATGSPEHRDRFRVDAVAKGLDVVAKEDLLEAGDLKTLQAMAWDQQGLVDFGVLMHSSFFYGFVRSSFSWSLAYRRGTLPEAGNPWPADKLEQDEYRDEVSAVAGHHGIAQEGIWP